MRFAKDSAGWKAWAAGFYLKHQEQVAAIPGLNEGKAREYCDAQLEALMAGGVAVVETWETEVPPRLAAMILGEM